MHLYVETVPVRSLENWPEACSGLSQSRKNVREYCMSQKNLERTSKVREFEN